MWFWIGLTLGVAAGAALGVTVMVALVVAGREIVEDHADALADETETWLRERGTR